MINNPPKSIFSKIDYAESKYKCQYLVIGTGAGGGVAGALLAERGYDVILLEEGGYYPVSSYTRNVGEMTARLYRNGGVFPFIGSPTIAFAEGCCVGGTTVINGGLLWRTPSGILEEWENKYGLKNYNNKNLEKHFKLIEKDLNVVIHKVENNSNLDSLFLLKAANEFGWKSVMVPRAVDNCDNSNFCSTGCPTGAKKSILETYIHRALRTGCRLFTNCRALKIEHSPGKAKRVLARINGTNEKIIEIDFEQLVVACGAIQTPHLLHRSKVSKLAGKNLYFHMNLKVVAKFREKVNAENGTIFTTQIQEFEREGILIMASNLKPHYLAMTLSHHGKEAVNYALDNYDYIAIYVAMVRSESIAHIFSGLGDQPFVWYQFNNNDLRKIKLALLRTAEVLFKAGATELYMPIHRIGKIKSIVELQKFFEKVKPKDFEIITVHVMGSCPMGTTPEASVVNLDGKVWNMPNIIVTDASIFPSNIGESPQGTIMAFAHEIIARHLSGG